MASEGVFIVFDMREPFGRLACIQSARRDTTGICSDFFYFQRVERSSDNEIKPILNNNYLGGRVCQPLGGTPAPQCFVLLENLVDFRCR